MKKIIMIMVIPILITIQSNALPWETWQDIRDLAKLNVASQSLLNSSFCPYNCRFDRTSKGDTRFLRVENDEAVIFEALNPGAITRIWMTSGFGTSLPLDNNIRIKFYFNGDAKALIDLSLPDLFNGTTPPFSFPLAADRLQSSGGNFSYVPITYEKSIKVTLSNAIDSTLWYQFSYQRLSSDAVVENFDFTHDFSELKTLLNRAGGIGWQNAEIFHTGGINLIAGEENILFSENKPGWIKSIKLSIDESYYDNVKIILRFDNNKTTELSLRQFFAIGVNNGVQTRSLLLGVNVNKQLYSHFPMPYFHNVSVSLRPDNNLKDIIMTYGIGTDTQMPGQDVGIFGTQYHETCPSTPLVDTPMLTLNKKGKWVGLFAEYSSIGTTLKTYLEGDERIYIDGDIHPTHYGTGTEDFFNGGFYFDQGDFSLALHGSPYSFNVSATQSTTSAYRLMLTDGIEFQKSIVAQLENGPFGDLAMCTRTVAYFYTQQSEQFEDVYQVVDELDLNSMQSIIDHQYIIDSDATCAPIIANYLDEPATSLTSNLCQYDHSMTTFNLTNNIQAKNLRIRRLFDNSHPNQVADVFVNNKYKGTFSYVPERSATYTPSVPDRRWQQESIDLAGINMSSLSIRITPRFSSTSVFTEAKYQLLGLDRRPIDIIFASSFD